MKFTYPQKKWVLTTALLAVLGVNVSLNSHSDGIASADFASTSGDLMESKVYTADGVVPVKYIDNGDEEVLALVPKKTTEGKICEGKCGYDTITLSVKNKSDIDSLNVELMKQLAKESTAPKKKVVKKEEVEEDAVEATEEVVAPKKHIVDPFKDIVKDCVAESATEEASVKCVSKKYLDILNDKNKSKNISAKQALEFYNEEIQTLISSDIAKARHISATVRRGQIDPTYYNEMLEFENPAVQVRDALARARDASSEILKDTPTKFEVVRQKAVALQAEILKRELIQYKEVKIQAEQAKNTNEGAFLLNEAMHRLPEVTSLHDMLIRNSTDSLRVARAEKNITYDQATAYNKYLLEVSNAVAQILGGKDSTFMQNVPTSQAVDLSGRLQNPGRGMSIGTIPGQAQVPTSQIGVIPQQGTTTVPAGTNPVSTRSGATLAAPLTTSGGGVSFGAPRDATAEALQMRQQIRSGRTQ
ncbi:hypothetical protein [Bdellovibrio sp.]|uniref:hypothetical protein n=1 Tax=Bdellovibrio TaxID=958 RepID=UPI003221CE32